MFPEGYVQGIAVDEARGYVCYSFTTSLIKTDIHGNLIGSVEGLAGYLGCIDIDREDGRSTAYFAFLGGERSVFSLMAKKASYSSFRS